MSKVNLNLSEIIKMMDKTAGADYSNWGIYEHNGKYEFGIEKKDRKVILTLLTIIESADSKFSEFGREEIYVSLIKNENGRLHWSLVKSS